MRSVQIRRPLPLSEVKPLRELLAYRDFCLRATRRALEHGGTRRERSPVAGCALVPFGEVDGLRYMRCPDTGSLFLEMLPDATVWAQLLASVAQQRQCPGAFFASVQESRAENVYRAKIEWIGETLRLQEIHGPGVLEVITEPSELTRFLQESGLFSDVFTVDEMSLAAKDTPPMHDGESIQVAVLLESLDRVSDPLALLRAVAKQLPTGGLVFLTALVASGFDLAVLGVRNLYLYPPDRANCFSRQGLEQALIASGLTPLEVSTPGALDLEIVQEHLRNDPSIPLSEFERQVVMGDEGTRHAFQLFLQQYGLSSHLRIVARKLE